MRRTKEEAAATRQAVLDAALIVFSEKGYAATNLDDIAVQAGLTRGAIYWHFKGGKVELYTTLVSEVSSRVVDVIEDAMAEGGSTGDMLRRMLVNTLIFLEEDEQYRQVTELTMFKSAHPELEAGLKLKSAGMRTTISEIADLIRAGVDAGELRADLDTASIGAAFVSLENGLAMTWLLTERAFSLHAAAEAAADVFIGGLRC